MKKRTMKDVLNYLKLRSQTLGSIVEYYETLERDRGFMKTDDMVSYQVAVSQLNELERLVSFIEGK